MSHFRSVLVRRAAPLVVAAFLVSSGGGGSVLAARPPAVVQAPSRTALDLAALPSGPVPADPIHNTVALPVHRLPRYRPSLLVDVTHSITATSRPGGGRPVGVVPTGSLQLGVPTVAWVVSVSKDGRYGQVPVPYSGHPHTGWIPLRGLRQEHTSILVRADLSRHLITVERRGAVFLRLKAATGSPATPTPPGLFFVTDRLAFSPGSVYGSFVFGISDVQIHLSNWPHNQLAIHGTNDPGSIGRSVSSGCLRVSERSLALLKPLLRIGTPVIIQG